MKSLQLFVSLLVATTAYAETKFPWMFFAKVNCTYIPLSGYYLGQRFEYSSMFSYGDPDEPPVEFVFKENKASTWQVPFWEYAGFTPDGFVFGVRIPPTTLRLNRKMKLFDGPFYSCDLLGTSWRGIVHGEPDEPVDYCFKVDIYLLPYDREAKKPVPVMIDQKKHHDSGSQSCEDDDEDEDSQAVEMGVCSFHFEGPNVRQELSDFLRDYTGDCAIYMNDERVFR